MKTAAQASFARCSLSVYANVTTQCAHNANVALGAVWETGERVPYGMATWQGGRPASCLLPLATRMEVCVEHIAVGLVTVLQEWLPRLVTVSVPRPGWQRGSLARCGSWTSRRYRNGVAV